MTATKEQIRKLMKFIHNHTLEVAAAKSGMSENTARKYIRQKGRKRKAQRHWKTHADVFADVWPTLTSMLNVEPGLEAKTLLEWLIEQHPEQFNSTHLRTLQRRVKVWKAVEGPDKEVIFPQILQPGKQSQSDFTNCNELNVTIGDQPFPHLLFHFMLPYSRWETVRIAFSESFAALADGYESAIAELGAVPPEHRTDNMGAAVPIGEASKKAFQSDWKALLKHYGVVPSSNNAGVAHENGSVEKSHDLFKKAVTQRLMLRGSRNFASIQAYEEFLESIKKKRNSGRKERLNEELRLMKELPARAWQDPKELTVGVSPWSTVVILRSTYSVPSRLIGCKLKALVYKDRIELWLGQKRLEQMTKVHPGEASLNYRHVIGHLVRKPRAFANYRFKDCLFPSRIFRQAFDDLLLNQGFTGERTYLEILNFAALGSESEVEMALQLLLAQGAQISLEAVKELVEQKRPVPDVQVDEPILSIYDELMEHSMVVAR